MIIKLDFLIFNISKLLARISIISAEGCTHPEPRARAPSTWTVRMWVQRQCGQLVGNPGSYSQTTYIVCHGMICLSQVLAYGRYNR